MPLEAPIASVQDRVAELNKRYRHHSASAVLEHALNDPLVGQVSLVSSFGTESIVLLHLLSVLDRTVPVLFLDTEMLFPETLAYQQEVAEKLRLSDVRRITPDREALFNRDPGQSAQRGLDLADTAGAMDARQGQNGRRPRGFHRQGRHVTGRTGRGHSATSTTIRC